MASIFRLQVVLKADSGIAKDHTTNALHFRVEDDQFGGLTEAERIDQIVAAMTDFYRASYNGVLSDRMADDGHEFNFYNLDDAEPRVPRYMFTWDFDGASRSTSLPTECAVVCSFQAERLAGTNQARRRNRIYLGPFSTAANANGVVQNGVRININAAALALSQVSDDENGWGWRIWSPTDQQAIIVNDGWVDNAWDTQRRRGISSEIRSTWTNPSD